jgi:hypothetical protein
MQIRVIVPLFISGNVQFTKGEVHTLTDEFAQQMIDEGAAEEVDIPPPDHSCTGFVPPAPRKKKGSPR